MGQGVLEFSHGEYSSRAAVGVLSGSPNVLYGDSAGRVWVGLSPGAICFEPPEQRLVVRDKVHDIRCFLEEPDGAFWVGTRGGGLMRWQQGQSTAFTMKDGLSYSNVWCLHRDNGGGLWIGTDNGLTRYKNGKFFPFYVRHGLLENTINSIVEDAVGNLWLGGLRGIYRVERSQLDAVADGRATKVQPFAVGTADGMASAETNGGENQPAGWKARDGLLWFPTIRGLVAFDPKSFPRHELPPPVLLESVKADGEIIAGDPDIEEPGGSSKPVVAPGAARPSLNSRPSTSYRSLSDAHVLEFKYTANSFIDSRRVRFRYRLLGTDRDWHEQTTERTARYSHLRPGQYRFEVTAANHHNTWNPAPAAFSFYVAPHWWQTATFYALCAAGVVGLAAAIQAYRLYWQHRLLKLEHQRELANERARIARDLHDDLGTGLTGLALELDVAGRDPAGAPSLSDRLRATARRARDMAERMREVVWTVNPSCDTVSSLADFLEQQVGQFLRADGVQVRLDFPEDIPPLPLGAEARHQLALSMREGLANVIRHAQATEVRVSLAIENSTLVLRIRDNGHGFAPAEREGHGLANMRQRLKRIGGTFECRSVPGEGTTLTFYLPL
jgi:signal transduction histidine kinase